MLEIKDGRLCFYQWDVNQKLVVNCNAKQVHFCNGTSETSLVVPVVDGMVDVPNILLQTAGKLRAYAYIIDDENTEKYTLCSAVFKVQERTKPDDYVYTETEVLRWSDLEDRIMVIERNILGTEDVVLIIAEAGLLDAVTDADGAYLADNNDILVF